MYESAIPSSFRAFRDEGVLNFSKLFCIYWDDYAISFPWFCLCTVSHLLICPCWNSLAPLERNQLDHSIQSF
jgi:hypothetical protein